MFTQRHYRYIAEAISQLPNSKRLSKPELVKFLSEVFVSDNYKFKDHLFEKASGIPEYEEWREAERKRKRIEREEKKNKEMNEKWKRETEEKLFGT